MNMVNVAVKMELIKLIGELQEHSAKFGAVYQGYGTAKKHEENMNAAKQRLHEMVEKL